MTFQDQGLVWSTHHTRCLSAFGWKNTNTSKHMFGCFMSYLLWNLLHSTSLRNSILAWKPAARLMHLEARPRRRKRPRASAGERRMCQLMKTMKTTWTMNGIAPTATSISKDGTRWNGTRKHHALWVARSDILKRLLLWDCHDCEILFQNMHVVRPSSICIVVCRCFWLKIKLCQQPRTFQLVSSSFTDGRHRFEDREASTVGWSRSRGCE